MSLPQGWEKYLTFTPLQQANFQVRFGLVAYAAGRDRNGAVYDHTFIGGSGPELVKHLYSSQADPGKYFTRDSGVMTRVLGSLKPQGNEDTLLALDIAADLPFGPAESTRRVIALFTDEKLEDGINGEEPIAMLPELIQKLQQRRIHLFIAAPLSSGLEELAAVDKAEIETIDGGDGLKAVDFGKLLAQMGKSISVASLQSGTEPAWKKALFGQNEIYWNRPRMNRAERERLLTVTRDKFGNLLGSQFDLVDDSVFAGLTIAVLHLYTSEGFDFQLPSEALKQKGFTIKRWTTTPPVKELKDILKGSCQLWVISGRSSSLDATHRKIICEFWNEGRGLYLWGDNDPYYADVNDLASALFGATLTGNIMGDQVVKHSTGNGKPGIVRSHPVCTGLDFLYEGISISSVEDVKKELEPVVYGSSGKIVVAAYNKDKRRALLDGGFTRLYYKWDTAGTARYVKNAAAWLVPKDEFSKRTGQ